MLVGISQVDFEQSYQRMHYSAFLYNMELANYTQYVIENNITDLNALKVGTDGFKTGMYR